MKKYILETTLIVSVVFLIENISTFVLKNAIYNLFFFLLLTLIHTIYKKFGFGIVKSSWNYWKEYLAYGFLLLLSVTVLRLFKLPKFFEANDYFIMIYIIFLAPISEELVFRQYLYKRWQNIQVSLKYQYIFSSLLFGVSHVTILNILIYLGLYELIGFNLVLGNSEELNLTFLQAFSTFFLGLIGYHLRVKSNSILPCVLAHMLYNFVFVISELFR